MQHDDADIDRFIDVFEELATRPHCVSATWRSSPRARGASSTSTALPHELAAELNGGRCPPRPCAGDRARRPRGGLVGGDHAARARRPGLDLLEQVLVHEAFGRNTNGVWWNMGGGYNVLAHGTPEQIERYLLPTLRGSAPTPTRSPRRDAGSDPGGDRGHGRAHGDGLAHRRPRSGSSTAATWPTSSSCMAERRRRRGAAADPLPGRHATARESRSSTTRRSRTPSRTAIPTVRLRRRGRADAVLGGRSARGDELTERVVHRGAHPHRRALRRRHASGCSTTATDWAIEREQFGAAHLSTSRASASRSPTRPADCAAARLLTHHVGRARRRRRRPEARARQGLDGQAVRVRGRRARAPTACVQVLGGRGYMRTNAAERLWRELRVDRIWEGTSRSSASSSPAASRGAASARCSRCDGRGAPRMPGAFRPRSPRGGVLPPHPCSAAAGAQRPSPHAQRRRHRPGHEPAARARRHLAGGLRACRDARPPRLSALRCRPTARRARSAASSRARAWRCAC